MNINFNIQTFEDYVTALREINSREYPLMGNNIVYPAMKLAGEAGELADKIGKHWRNKAKEIREGNWKNFTINQAPITELLAMSPISLTVEQKIEIVKEMGDVLWYIFALCEELQISMNTVAILNVEKLHDRKQRDVICSEGDNR